MDVKALWNSIIDLHSSMSFILLGEPTQDSIAKVQDHAKSIIRQADTLKTTLQSGDSATVQYVFDPSPYSQRSHYETIDSLSSSTYSSGGTIMANVHSYYPTPQFKKTKPQRQFSFPPPDSTGRYTGDFIQVGKPGVKKKSSAERECYICKETESPEWRKGPTGAHTLCNACGLCYSKKEKAERERLFLTGMTLQAIEAMIDSLQESIVSQVYVERFNRPREAP